MPTRAPSLERAAAVDLLTQITEDAAYANIALRKALDSHPEWEPRKKAFVTELVNGTLRNLRLIDYILNHFSKTPVRSMKPFIRSLLRVSVYQIRFLDKVPPAAAVDEAVRLAKARRFAPLSGYVNGVLRAVIRGMDSLTFPDPVKEPEAFISTVYSFPPPLTKALFRWLGSERASSLCKQSHESPPVTLFANPLRVTREALMESLRREGAVCEEGVLTNECVYLRHASDMTKWAAYKQGLFHVMDEGALLAVKALSPRPGMRVLDLCAAPGGKAFACACLMAEGTSASPVASVAAFDIHPHKLQLMNESKTRLGLKNVETGLRDAVIPQPDLNETADAVMLDVPCSGLGILRKKPDIKYTKNLDDIPVLAEQQRRMLSAASAYVKPSGVLLYCTCTVSREENIDNIRWFTQHYPFRTETLPASVMDALQRSSSFAPDVSFVPDFFMEEKCLQLLPGTNNDGFFIALLRRCGN